MFKVVVDTNVVVSALLKYNSNPAFIISLILRNQLKLCLGLDIFNEYKGVLAYEKFKKLDRNEVKNFLLRIKKNALWFVPDISVTFIKDHPSDNKILECAIVSKADFLITGNIKHFPFERFNQTRIVMPTDFINIIAKDLAG